MTNKDIVFCTLAVLLTAGALFLIAPEPIQFNLSEEKLQCESRSSILARGQVWVDKNVPYNKTYDGYRSDCSGFVSMCWGLPKPGHTT